MNLVKKRRTQILFCILRNGGGDRNRTGVQTYPPKAFYMFISALLVGKVQERNTPTSSLAVYS